VNEPQEQQETQAEGKGRSVAGNPTGGGLAESPDTRSLPPRPPSGNKGPVADEGNLEYARKQTDLVLDRLENQLKDQNVDQDLLDKLGWSEDDLKKFVDRWKNLKQAAQRDGAGSAAQRSLNDALGALGLKRQAFSRAGGEVPTDDVRNLRDAARTRTPLEWEEEVRAYTRGIAE
jgi:hypothetical protein